MTKREPEATVRIRGGACRAEHEEWGDRWFARIAFWHDAEGTGPPATDLTGPDDGFATKSEALAFYRETAQPIVRAMIASATSKGLSVQTFETELGRIGARPKVRAN